MTGRTAGRPAAYRVTLARALHALAQTLAALALAALLLPAAPATAQLRPMDPVDWSLLDDDWTVALDVGGALYHRQPASLAGVTGRLWEAGAVDAAWKVGDVVVRVSGVALRALRVDSVVDEPVAGVRRREPGDVLRDAGEVVVSTVVPLYGRPGLRTLLRFGTRLPVSDSEIGLGRDQTDFFALLGARARRHHTTLAVEAGLGIHGTHGRDYYEQVDVLLYTAELVHPIGWLRTSLSLVGQVDGLDGHTVRGNEDLQEVRLGIRAGGSRWMRAEVVRGLRTSSPEWGVRLGIGARW